MCPLDTFSVLSELDKSKQHSKNMIFSLICQNDPNDSLNQMHCERYFDAQKIFYFKLNAIHAFQSFYCIAHFST